MPESNCIKLEKKKGYVFHSLASIQSFFTSGIVKSAHKPTKILFQIPDSTILDIVYEKELSSLTMTVATQKKTISVKLTENDGPIRKQMHVKGSDYQI